MWLSDLVHDVLPKGALTRWSLSFPILVFVDGLLLAFALVEPRVGDRAPEAKAEETEAAVPTRPAPTRPAAAPAPEPEPADLRS